MKTKTLCSIALFLFAGVSLAFAQSSTFTYQGRLEKDGVASSGTYDLQITAFDAATSGNIVGGPVTNSATIISNGLFTAQLDLGANVFTGPARWLQIGIRTNGSVDGFTILSPLQRITSSPYAIQSANAASANVAGSANSVAAANISGTVALGQLPPSVVTNGAPNVSLSGTFNGSFNGNGGGLTSLNASQLAGVLPSASLPTNVLTSISSSLQTNQTLTYSTASVNTVTVPPGATNMIVKLWGAGGGGSFISSPNSGGGGAFVQKVIAVSPGQIFTIVVGERGNYNSGNLGGKDSGIAEGGQPSNETDPDLDKTHGGGAQGSSLLQFTGGNYILKALAGGGGGAGSHAGGGAGGNPGVRGGAGTLLLGEGGGGGDNGVGGVGGSAGRSGGAGASIAPAITTTGVALLSSVGGKGGTGAANGQVNSGGGGGGGGGYGGGGGGAIHTSAQNFGLGAGGGGGGSLGDIIIAGNGTNSGNNADSHYIFPCGKGGTGKSAGSDGLAVVIFQGPVHTINGTVATSGLTSSGTGPLAISGSATISGDLTVDGNLQVSSNLTATGQSTFNSSSQTRFNGIYSRGGAPGGNGFNNNGYAFGNGGDGDSGMYSLGDGQIQFYANNVLIETITPGGVSVHGNLTSSGNITSSSGQITSRGALAGIYTQNREDSNDEWAMYSSNNRLIFFNSSVGSNQMSVDKSGNVRARGSYTTTATPDIAETIAAASDVEAGDIVCADPSTPESVIRCSKSNRGILGVISDGTGGFLINSHAHSMDAPLTGKPLVLAGRVPVKVSLENGPVNIGDTLAPSSVPGVAMRATGNGPTVGIALDVFNAGSPVVGKGYGTVLCFVKADQGNGLESVQQMREMLSERDARIEALEASISELKAAIQR